MSVYSEIGGAPAVEAVVEDFYRRLLDDETLVGFFKGINMDRLKHHQRVFVTVALGGPITYEGRDMVTAHATLGITNQAFNTVVMHLEDTLVSLGVPDEAIIAIGRALIPYQLDVVTREDPPAAASGF